MATSGSSESFERLLAHDEWVRRLALRLCGSSADDVAQDTWIEALRESGTARSPRAWLGGIVRHLSRRTLRDARMRTEREIAGAHEATMPEPEEMLARAELQTRVLAAVAALDEPYRVVVLMHYYESLSGEQIAERLRVPSSTVRNRIARAHERLRAKLDREYGGDHAAWAMLLAPSTSSLVAHPIAAGAGITMKLVAVSVATVAVVGAIFVWSSSREPASNASALASSLAATSVPLRESPVASSHAAADDRTAREPLASTSAAPIEHVLVAGRIRGGDDASLASADISFWDEDGTQHRASVGKNATYSIFGLHPGRKEVVVSCRGFMPLDEDCELPLDRARVEHDLSLQRALVLPVKISVHGQSTSPGDELRRDWNLSVVATRDEPSRIANVLERVPRLVGVGFYRERDVLSRDASIPAGYSGVLEVHGSLPVYASCVLHDTVMESRVVRGNESELVFEIDPAAVESKLGTATVRCIDESGAPVANARVEITFRDGGGSVGKTDEHGVARFEHLAPGMRHFDVHAPPFAFVDRWITIAPGELLDMGTIEMHPPSASASGRIVDEAGRGVAARIFAIPVSASASPRAIDSNPAGTATSDGTFQAKWADAGPARLVASHDEYALEAIDVDTSRGAAKDLELRLEKGTLVTFRLARGANEPVDFVIADASGSPLCLAFAYPTSAMRKRLKPGRYELRFVEDDKVVRTEPLEVGTSPLVKEVRTR
jgi:RNA polymerase sigma-70 factor (ECF subfamily)